MACHAVNMASAHHVHVQGDAQDVVQILELYEESSEQQIPIDARYGCAERDESGDVLHRGDGLDTGLALLDLHPKFVRGEAIVVNKLHPARMQIPLREGGR